MSWHVIETAELERLRREGEKAAIWQAATAACCCLVLVLGILLSITGQSHDRMAEKVVRQELGLQR